MNGSGRRKLDSLTVSYDRLLELLEYDPETGIFKWKIAISRGIKVGQIAGVQSPQGYIKIGIGGFQHVAHRLAWFYIHKEWVEQLDHIDRDRSNNAIANLRPATGSQNQGNRTVDNATGFKGVTRKGNRYIAQITINYCNTYLGSFDTPEQAAEAYKQAALAHFGEFTNV